MMKTSFLEYSSICIQLSAYKYNRAAQIRLWRIIHPILVVAVLNKDWDKTARIWAENKRLVEEAVQ